MIRLCLSVVYAPIYKYYCYFNQFYHIMMPTNVLHGQVLEKIKKLPQES